MPARETEIIGEEEIKEIVGIDVFEDIKRAKNNLNSILNSFLACNARFTLSSFAERSSGWIQASQDW